MLLDALISIFGTLLGVLKSPIALYDRFPKYVNASEFPIKQFLFVRLNKMASN